MTDLYCVLASGAVEVPYEWPSVSKAIWLLVGIVFFLLLNAFFVASEFAIVKVRPTQIDGELKSKPRRAKTAKHVVDHLDGYLSANQLGITIASLALGFLGEPFVAALVGPLLYRIPGLPDLVKSAIPTISFVLAIISFTFLHGEAPGHLLVLADFDDGEIPPRLQVAGMLKEIGPASVRLPGDTPGILRPGSEGDPGIALGRGLQQAAKGKDGGENGALHLFFHRLMVTSLVAGGLASNHCLRSSR